MKIGDLVKHRVSDRLGIILCDRYELGNWRVVRWSNGMVTTAQTLNLETLCK